ncbi:MAG: GNAT family N-acetyltransferase [Acidimicrobiia bacterium]
MLKFRDDPENHRYLAEDDDGIVGMAVYHIRGDRYLFVHTEVNEEYEGRGVGSNLARYALDDVRAKGNLIVPVCPFIAAWLKRHPDYQDMLDQDLLDAINERSATRSD